MQSFLNMYDMLKAEVDSLAGKIDFVKSNPKKTSFWFEKENEMGNLGTSMTPSPGLCNQKNFTKTNQTQQGSGQIKSNMKFERQQDSGNGDPP